MFIANAQLLWLARDIVADNPLPWQKSQAKLTPGRVAQAMGGILASIGTPASAPKQERKVAGVANRGTLAASNSVSGGQKRNPKRQETPQKIGLTF